jgi:acyl-CoA thioesterase II
MTHPLLPLEPTGPDQWTLFVTDGLSAGRDDHRFLFGGAGLAAAVTAMEAATGRPAIWATAQYLSYVRPGSTVSITVSQPSIGRTITQARASLTHDGKEIVAATAALGARDGLSDQWARHDPVPPPEDCADIAHWNAGTSIGGRFHFRPARGYFGYSPPGERQEDGRLYFWIRPVEDLPIDRVVLAMVADFVTPGIRNATRRKLGGNSLDNTIRYGNLVPTDWALCEVMIDAIASGITHGTMRIFARSGELLAVASQSMILRVRE